VAGGPAGADVGEDELLAVAAVAPVPGGADVAVGARSWTGGTRLVGEPEPELPAPPLQAARSTTAPTTGRARRQGDPGRPGR
jgi:hypothetical protein